MLKSIKKIINVIVNILLTFIIIVAIFLVYTTIQTKIKKQDYPNVFGYTFFKVVTGSMADTINIDDLVIVEIKEEETEYKENDIIVFKQDDNMITHRIIKINENEIITKGDANNTTDEPITRDQIIGLVVKIIPNVGIWQKVIMSPQVFLSIITTIFLFGLAFSDDEKTKQQVVTDEKKEDKDNG